MAMPTFVAAGTVFGGITTGNFPLPAGWATNDILLLAIETNEGESITTPSGWAEVTGSPVEATGTGTRLTVLWRRAQASDGANVTTNDPGDHIYGVILAFRGCPTTGDPWDVTSTSTETTSDTSVSITGATTTVADCLVVAMCARGLDNTDPIFGSWANSDLSSVTEVSDDGTTQGSGGGIGIATGGKATAGAYGATTATLASASAKSMMTIALKPATGTLARSFAVVA